MNENIILKVCTKCNTEKPLIYFCKSKASKDGVKSICKVCMYESHREYLLNESNLLRRREWERDYTRKKTKEKQLLHRCSICGDIIGDKDLKTKYCKACRIKENRTIKNKSVGVETIEDRYVIKLLCNSGFPKGSINNELIEVKRLIIKTDRLCKTSQI